jgi:hypothetical protein
MAAWTTSRQGLAKEIMHNYAIKGTAVGILFQSLALARQSLILVVGPSFNTCENVVT